MSDARDGVVRAAGERGEKGWDAAGAPDTLTFSGGLNSVTDTTRDTATSLDNHVGTMVARTVTFLLCGPLLPVCV